MTMVFSQKPDFSRWWCNGAILKTRFPVSLKDATCIITDAPSITYTEPNNAMSKGFPSDTAQAEMIAPRKRDPVSPINTFAG